MGWRVICYNLIPQQCRKCCHPARAVRGIRHGAILQVCYSLREWGHRTIRRLGTKQKQANASPEYPCDLVCIEHVWEGIYQQGWRRHLPSFFSERLFYLRRTDTPVHLIAGNSKRLCVSMVNRICWSVGTFCYFLCRSILTQTFEHGIDNPASSR